VTASTAGFSGMRRGKKSEGQMEEDPLEVTCFMEGGASAFGCFAQKSPLSGELSPCVGTEERSVLLEEREKVPERGNGTRKKRERAATKLG